MAKAKPKQGIEILSQSPVTDSRVSAGRQSGGVSQRH